MYVHAPAARAATTACAAVFGDARLRGMIRSYLERPEGVTDRSPSPLEVDFEGLMPLSARKAGSAYDARKQALPALDTNAAAHKLSPFSPSFVPRSNPSPATSLYASRFWSPKHPAVDTAALCVGGTGLKSVRGDRPADMTWVRKLPQHHQSWRRRVDAPVGPGIPSGVDTTLTKVFLGSLAWKTTSMTIYNTFARYGEIREAAVVYDETGPVPRSKGYGFVTFVSPASASAATMDGSPVIDGRRVDCILAALGTKCKSPKTVPANCKPWLRDMMRARKAAERPAHAQSAKACIVSGNRFTFDTPRLSGPAPRPVSARGRRGRRPRRRSRPNASPRGTIPGRRL